MQTQGSIDCEVLEFRKRASMEVRGGDQRSESLDPLTEGLDGGDLITSLQTQLRCLQNRVKELEIENARLASQISSCQCGKIGEKLKCLAAKGDSSTGKGRKSGAAGDTVGLRSELEGNEIGRSTSENLQEGIKDFDEITKKTSGKGIPGCNRRIMHNCAKRFVALKVMYFGQRFYGFASEAQMEPTVESEIFKALEKTRLLVGDKRESRYSRCGRTDKGVSSVGQVISLLLRSKLKQIRTNATHEEITKNDHCEVEIDYVRILNRALPQDIRVLGWCAAPTDLHARFSCFSREYMYLFWRESLDIRAMEMACKKFIGEHDFRNFCKMDAVNVHSYRRHITSFEILSYNKSFEGDQIWAMTIKGSAFLWHQVRCMVAVLFMVGQGLESPSVIDVLLDTKRTPRKPQYCMAPELPLILHTCEFEGLNFVCSTDAREDLHKHLKNEFQTYKLKAVIFHEALLSCVSVANDKGPLNHGKMKRKASHIPLVARPTEPSYEERCAKLKSRMQKQEPAA